MSRQRAALVDLLLGVTLMVSCAPSAPPGAAPSAGASQAPQARIPGGTVTIRMQGDWGKPIDGGQTVTTANGGMLSSAMYDRLVAFSGNSSKLVPYLAESWTTTPASVTFKIRKDATCADGTPITAGVVYNSYARFISPETKSPWTSTIFGPGPYTISRDDAASTFTFGIPKPYNQLVYAFARDWNGIICPAGLQPGADFTKQSYGSGPWIFESAVQGSEYVVKKRDGWNWGPEGRTSSASGFPDRVVFKVVANETTAANLLLTGGLDISLVNGADVKRLEADKTFDEQVAPSFAPYTFQMNFAPGRPANDIAVRKAVYTAVDPKAWNQAAADGKGLVSTNFQANPGGYCYSDLSSIMPRTSVADARKQLQDGGYTLGPDGKFQKGGKTLTLRVVGTSFTGSGVEYIGDTLNQVGIKVDLVNTDYVTFAQYFGKTDYDVIVGLFGQTVPIAGTSPNFMRGKFPSEGGNNRLNLDDPKLSVLVDTAYAAPDGPEACAAWKEFNTYMITNWIALPWVGSVTPWFSKAGVFKYVTFGATLDPPTLIRAK